MITMHFDILINVDYEDFSEELGEELSKFLQESFFNGDDILEVRYKGYEDGV